MREIVSQASDIQRTVLVIEILSLIFTGVFTWDMVIHREVAEEASSWTALFISEFRSWGLVISSLARFALFFPFWIGWVASSRMPNFGAYLGTLAGSLLFFAITFIDFVHDLLVFAFNTGILLPLLVDWVFKVATMICVFIAALILSKYHFKQRAGVMLNRN